MRALLAAASLSLSALFCLPGHSEAQTITVLVPYPPGGTADVMARMIAAPLGQALGQTVIVDNKAGAAGTIAAAAVARAVPDGRTLLFTNAGPSAIAPAMSKGVSYDPERDFTAISLVARSPLLLVVNGSTDIRDLRGLIAYAKANPGKVEYSSPGIGSFTHLATEQFAQAAGIQLLHVPYKGQAPAVTAVMSGEVKMMLSSSSGVMEEMIRAGKLRLIGVSTREASRLAPGAPPIASVLPGYETEFWFGFVAPANTNPAMVKTLHAAIQKVLADPAIGRQLQVVASEVMTGPSEEFQRYLGSEAKRWKEVVRAAKIEPEN